MGKQAKKRGAGSLFGDVWASKKLLLGLARNDFKKKFSGSYLGIFWAFVQPVIQVFIYWFVFEKALHAGAQQTKAGITVPYVLWLVAGLVPWFYFADVWNAATGVFVEYKFLVKQVMFRVSILPPMKILSGLFVHVFFVAFMAVLYIAYGRFPGWIFVQVLYYSFCMMVLLTALAYLCSAVCVFFRDLSQVISIFLQVLIWMTPIMWNMDGMQNIPGWVVFVLKLNPMYYVVSGYRDTMIGGVWFWQKPALTLYFWGVSAALLLLGTTAFRRLQPHFADVL